MLYDKDLAKVSNEHGWLFASYHWWHKVLIHILPFAFSFINLALSKGVFVPGHALFTILIGCVYIPINCFGTLTRGEPLYFFMPWNDYKTLAIAAIIFLFACLVQQVVCFVTIKLKTRPIDSLIKTRTD